MAKKETKTTTKKSTKKAEMESGGVAVAERPQMVEPFGWMGDWMGHWPAFIREPFNEPMERFERLMGASEMLRVEESTDEDGTTIRVEIPGVDPEEDIDITVTPGRLMVSARRERREEETDNGRRSEFHYGSFRRTMTLPMGVDAEDVKATYTDGILEIHVPVADDSGAEKKVSITRSDG